jgi:adenylate cyclase
VSSEEVAERAGVSASTLRRWVAEGLVPQAPEAGNGWSPLAAAHVRLVSRLRERGHSIADIRQAVEDGRLAFGYLEDLLPATQHERSLKEAAKLTGLEPALIRRIYSNLGFTAETAERIGDEDLEMLQHVAEALRAGFPFAAFMQLTRVYGQALEQIADAEVRLFHLYVHEPLVRDGLSGIEVAEQVDELAARVQPLAQPLMELVHRRYLRHFVERDVIGHMEEDFSEVGIELGHLRIAIAFADLAGFTQLTEQQGDEEAATVVERFVANVTHTLPDDARIVKTVGDEVMVVSTDTPALVDWALGFQSMITERPQPRIGIHAGEVVYRDGDYFGAEVNRAARVAARAAAGEVLVTRAIVESADRYAQFERIGEVRLKGFSEPTELLLAKLAEED